MTEEQMKIEAEIYASKYGQANYMHSVAYRAHLAGAHSRDEEVEMLQNQIEELSEQLKMNAENIQKLRHPWVKIAERKPSLETEEERKKKCIVRFGEYGHFAHIILNAQDFLMMSGEAIEGSYWMYLPELKKGE